MCHDVLAYTCGMSQCIPWYVRIYLECCDMYLWNTVICTIVCHSVYHGMLGDTWNIVTCTVVCCYVSSMLPVEHHNMYYGMLVCTWGVTCGMSQCIPWYIGIYLGHHDMYHGMLVYIPGMSSWDVILYT
jgi:hypothetical protein